MKNCTMSRGRGASNGDALLEVHASEEQKAVVQTRSTRHTWMPCALRPSVEAISAAAVLLVLAVLFAAFSAVLPVAAQMSQELQMGLESHRAGNFKDAIDIYTAVIEKDKQSAEAYNWRGMAYDEMNQLDQALADLNEAIRLSPKYADAYNNRGEVYRKKNMLNQALADYRKAVELDKTFAEAYFNMGLVDESLGKGAQAARAYSEYLKLKPDAEDKDAVQAKIATLQKAAGQAARPAGQQPTAGAPKPRPQAKVEGEKKVAPKPSKPPQQGVPALPPGFDKGAPGMPGIPPEVMMAITGMGYISMIVNVLIYVFIALMLFFIANKTGTALPWLAFIPIAQIYLMVRIAGKPIWWLALLIVLPIVAAVILALSAVDPTGGIIAVVLGVAALLVCVAAWLLVNLGIASARGKSVIWGILLFLPCTNLIALGYLGLSE